MKMPREEVIREEAIKVLLSDSAPYKEWEEAVSIAVEALKEQRKHGEWIDTTGNNDFVCSVCKHKAQIGCIEYCGNCGADMRKKEGE